MDQHAETIAKSVSNIAYSISGSLVIGDWLSVLDQHAAAFGVLLGFATYLTSLIFHVMNHRVIRSNNGERRRGEYD